MGLERATAWGGVRPLARALRASAQTRPIEERVPMLEEAVALTDRGWCGVDGARYRIDVAEARLAGDEVEPAVDHLQRAYDLASSAGAQALVHEASSRLTALGVRPKRQSTARGLHTLSPAERRAVDLAAQDRTNREIAETLFVTVKTVETHLGSAYRKLGIRSRGELRAALERGATSLDER
jgi:DNA-binding CsgD family transcriptional regulator